MTFRIKTGALLWTTLSVSALVWSGCGVQELAGCASDADCRAGRVCAAGACVFEGAPAPEDMGRADQGAPDMSSADMGAPEDMGGADLGLMCSTPTSTRCGDTCVNIVTDPQHCGTCDAACESGWQCVRGTCLPPPPPICTPGSCQGFMWCDTDTGRCEPGCESDAQCLADQVCTVDHQCMCPAGTVLCDSGCCREQECVNASLSGWSNTPNPLPPQRGRVDAEVGTSVSLQVTFDRPVNGFIWQELQRPAASLSTLVDAGRLQRRLMPDVAGAYLFAISSPRVPLCQPAQITVQATGGGSGDVTLELTWDTPGDMDQTDSRGADMDLHYLRPGAQVWNSGPDAIFWSNRLADWGVQGDPSDDPMMGTDDTDGAGPERITHTRVTTPGLYPVGVRYFSSRGYGTSVATLKVFIGGRLTDTYTSRPMAQGEFWWPLSIMQPGGIISPTAATPYSMGFPPLAP